MSLSQNEIKNSYQFLKKEVFKFYRTGDLNATLHIIDKAVGFVQQFNWIYTDEDFEQLLNEISHKKLTTPSKFTPNPERVVLFDDWCTSYVLALQYVEALSLHFKEVLYVTGRDVEKLRYKNILDNIRNYPNVRIAVIPQHQNRFERSQNVLNTIVDFGPSNLFLHIGYNSPVTLALYSLPKEITRYLINLADQTFWLGAKAIDFTLEFRPFGATVSHERRGLKKEQLLYFPFYPVRDGNPFQGFPNQTKGKVVIFSGGDFYKTLDPDFTYWGLVRDVLNQNPEAIFLFATKNNMGKTKDFIDGFIKTNHFEERFIYIGFRPDIDEVFKHCDIFMGTSPICGSLTSQLAALNRKPILQYYLPNTYDDETEQALCHNAELRISFTDKSAFLKEANRLISDKTYRIAQGESVNKAMFSREQFNQRLIEVVTTHNSPSPLKTIDFKMVAERWWWNEKLGFYNTTQELFGLVGKQKILKQFPKLAIKYYFSRIIKKIVLHHAH